MVLFMAGYTFIALELRDTFYKHMREKALAYYVNFDVGILTDHTR